MSSKLLYLGSGALFAGLAAFALGGGRGAPSEAPQAEAPEPKPVVKEPKGSTSRPTKKKHASDCVGSCAVVVDEHPDLSRSRFELLAGRLATGRLDSENQDLETLLFHHERARKLFEQPWAKGLLPPKRQAWLKQELAQTHAWLDVRVVDAAGVERLRLRPTRVPLGEKQHLWPEQRVALQSVEVSGTVKRVGLNHLWTRL